MNSEIKTQRLILRNYSETDLDNVYKLKAEPLVWRFSSQDATTNIEDAKNYLNSVIKSYEQSNCNFQGLFLKDTGEYIGEAGILSFNKRCNRVVVGYNILPTYWGKGYATEITKALVKYLFEEEKVERIEALAMDTNGASKRVLEKSGFFQEGLLRNFAYIHGSFANVGYYGMIKEDYCEIITG